MMKKIFSFIFFIFVLLLCNECSKKESVKIIDIDLTNESYAYVVKEGNDTLLTQFNSYLKEILQW